MVDVVEGESPLQLVLRRPLRDHREELHEVAERYPASPIPESIEETKVEGGRRLYLLGITMEEGRKMGASISIAQKMSED